MTDDHFLRAIAADPWSDGPRLLYADWLDERGDPRAQYLRITHEAAERMRGEKPWDDLERELISLIPKLPPDVDLKYDVVLGAVTPEHAPAVHVAIRERTGRGIYQFWPPSGPKILWHAVPHEEAVRRRAEMESAPGCQIDVQPATGMWRGAAGKRFDVVLMSCEPTNMIGVIKVVRTHTGFGLLEAKNLVQSSLPTAIWPDLPLEEAIRRKAGTASDLNEASAQIAIRPAIPAQ